MPPFSGTSSVPANSDFGAGLSFTTDGSSDSGSNTESGSHSSGSPSSAHTADSSDSPISSTGTPDIGRKLGLLPLDQVLQRLGRKVRAITSASPIALAPLDLYTSETLLGSPGSPRIRLLPASPGAGVLGTQSPATPVMSLSSGSQSPAPSPIDLCESQSPAGTAISLPSSGPLSPAPSPIDLCDSQPSAGTTIPLLSSGPPSPAPSLVDLCDSSQSSFARSNVPLLSGDPQSPASTASTVQVYTVHGTAPLVLLDGAVSSDASFPPGKVHTATGGLPYAGIVMRGTETCPASGAVVNAPGTGN